MTGPAADPRVLLVQLGARRQYAMPAALESAGMLAALYTDICGNVGPGRLLAPFAALGSGRLGKLAKRQPPQAVAARTRSFPRWTLAMQRAARITDAEQRVRAYDKAHRDTAQAMISAGFGDATHVLVMLMEARGLLTEAKRRGLTTVTDVNVALSAERIVREERARHPEWEPDGLYYGATLDDPAFQPLAETLQATDLFLCPSAFVRDDLVDNHGVPADRTVLLPYAVNPKWFSITPAPQKGRIFFAGEAGIRKGIHTLAEAARILRGRGRDYAFRIAGNASDTVRNRPETSELTFLGRQSHEAMRSEFAAADLFAFPSLAEGSAGVTYEALGAGVPLVTTHAAGSVARDGIEALLVSPGDPVALADAIEAIVEDRAMRDRMANAARERAREFSWDAFASRLPDAIRSFGQTNGPAAA